MCFTLSDEAWHYSHLHPNCNAVCFTLQQMSPFVFMMIKVVYSTTFFSNKACFMKEYQCSFMSTLKSYLAQQTILFKKICYHVIIIIISCLE